MVGPLAEQRLMLSRRGAAVLYALGAERVWLFGSLACGRRQDPRSDIDLAVEGLPPHRVEQATPAVQRAIGFHVDVVSMDDNLPMQLRAQALRNRVLLPRVDLAPAEPRPGKWYGAPEAPGRRLHLQRLDAVAAALNRTSATRVIDLGCGGGWLLELLACQPHYQSLAGVDVDVDSVRQAQERLSKSRGPTAKTRVQLFVGTVTWKDPRLLGWDAAVAVEVIEHLDAPRRHAFEHVVFEFARPATVVITTPNADYNTHFHFASGERFRHSGHQFEWSRAEFLEWAAALAVRTGYTYELAGIGPVDEALGSPTQMAVFSR